MLTNRTGASNEWISNVYFRIFPFVNETVTPVPKFAEASKNAIHVCIYFVSFAYFSKSNDNQRDANI